MAGFEPVVVLELSESTLEGYVQGFDPAAGVVAVYSDPNAPPALRPLTLVKLIHFVQSLDHAVDHRMPAPTSPAGGTPIELRLLDGSIVKGRLASGSAHGRWLYPSDNTENARAIFVPDTSLALDQQPPAAFEPPPPAAAWGAPPPPSPSSAPAAPWTEPNRARGIEPVPAMPSLPVVGPRPSEVPASVPRLATVPPLGRPVLSDQPPRPGLVSPFAPPPPAATPRPFATPFAYATGDLPRVPPGATPSPFAPPKVFGTGDVPRLPGLPLASRTPSGDLGPPAARTGDLGRHPAEGSVPPPAWSRPATLDPGRPASIPVAWGATGEPAASLTSPEEPLAIDHHPSPRARSTSADAAWLAEHEARADDGLAWLEGDDDPVAPDEVEGEEPSGIDDALLAYLDD